MVMVMVMIDEDSINNDAMMTIISMFLHDR